MVSEAAKAHKKAYAAKYRAEHRAEILAYHKKRRESGIASAKLKEWHLNHPGAMAKYHAKSYAKHKETRLAKAHEWYRSNTKNHRAACDRWRRNNPERNREITRKDNNGEAHVKWKRSHPESVKKVYRDYYHRNKAAFVLKSKRRRAKIKGCVVNRNADAFYKFVRSKKRIRCYYCGGWVSGKEAHIDHVIALAKSGNHSSENLCASCERCNKRKCAKLPSEIPFIDQGLLNL